MTFDKGMVEYRNTCTAACTQFSIRHNGPVHMTLSSRSRYAYLTLDDAQSQAINTLAKQVGRAHEKGPERNTFMVYYVTFRPNQNEEEGFHLMTSEEKQVFEEIYNTARDTLAKEMGWAVQPADVARIVLNKTVDFSFIEANRACELQLQFSQEAADRLGIDQNSKFRSFSSSAAPTGTEAYEIHPGQH